MATVCQWFGPKTTGMVFSDLASKPVAMVSGGLASKPDVTVSSGLASKHAVTVFQFGPQNPRLRFGDLGLKTKQAIVCRLRHKTRALARDTC
jgi:hypothetical protein